MAVATGTALALGAGASALGGYLNSRNMQSASAPYRSFSNRELL